MFSNLREDVSKYYIKVLSLRSYFIFKMKKHHEKSTNNKLLMIKTYLSKTSIFKAFAAVCIFGISISGCTSKKKTPMETTDTTENELTMLVGTYTSGTSKGIYSYRFNEEDGTATPLSETEVENPSYLVPSADGKFVYAVSEFNNTQAAANAFAFNKEKGTLQLLNSQQTGGEDPCYSCLQLQISLQQRTGQNIPALQTFPQSFPWQSLFRNIHLRNFSNNILF